MGREKGGGRLACAGSKAVPAGRTYQPTSVLLDRDHLRSHCAGS